MMLNENEAALMLGKKSEATSPSFCVNKAEAKVQYQVHATQFTVQRN